MASAPWSLGPLALCTEAPVAGWAPSGITLAWRMAIRSIPGCAATPSTSASVTAQAMGWPTLRTWQVEVLFWNTTLSAAR